LEVTLAEAEIDRRIKEVRTQQQESNALQQVAEFRAKGIASNNPKIQAATEAYASLIESRIRLTTTINQGYNVDGDWALNDAQYMKAQRDQSKLATAEADAEHYSGLRVKYMLANKDYAISDINDAEQLNSLRRAGIEKYGELYETTNEWLEAKFKHDRQREKGRYERSLSYSTDIRSSTAEIAALKYEMAGNDPLNKFLAERERIQAASQNEVDELELKKKYAPAGAAQDAINKKIEVTKLSAQKAIQDKLRDIAQSALDRAKENTRQELDAWKTKMNAAKEYVEYLQSKFSILSLDAYSERIHTSGFKQPDLSKQIEMQVGRAQLAYDKSQAKTPGDYAQIMSKEYSLSIAEAMQAGIKDPRLAYAALAMQPPRTSEPTTGEVLQELRRINQQSVDQNQTLEKMLDVFQQVLNSGSY
jgi:hypothetical protein